MPQRIPGAGPRISRVIPSEVDVGRGASPADFGHTGDQAIAGALGQVADLGAKLFEEEMSSRVSGAVADANSRLNALYLEVEANPDHNARSGLYESGAAKIAQETRGTLRHSNFQDEFTDRFELDIERRRVGTLQGVRRAQIDAAGANRRKFIDQELENARNETDPEQSAFHVQRALAEAQRGTDGGDWSANYGETLRQGIESQAEADSLKGAVMKEFDDLQITVPDGQDAFELRLEAAEKLPIKLRGPVTALLKDQEQTETYLAKEKQAALTAQLSLRRSLPPTDPKWLSSKEITDLALDAEKAGQPWSTGMVTGLLAIGQPGKSDADLYPNQPALLAAYWSKPVEERALVNVWSTYVNTTKIDQRIDPELVKDMHLRQGTDVHTGSLGDFDAYLLGWATAHIDPKVGTQKFKEHNLFIRRWDMRRRLIEGQTGRPWQQEGPDGFAAALQKSWDETMVYDVPWSPFNVEMRQADVVRDPARIRERLEEGGHTQNKSEQQIGEMVTGAYKRLYPEGPVPINTEWSGFPTPHPMMDGEDNVQLFAVRDNRGAYVVMPSMIDGIELSNEQAMEQAQIRGIDQYPRFLTPGEAEVWMNLNYGNIDVHGRLMSAPLAQPAPPYVHPSMTR